MKKVLAIVLVLLMTAAVFAGCAAPAVKTGLGIVTSIGHSTDAGEKDGKAVDANAQVDSVICTVTLDGNKVVKVHYDTAQTKIAVDSTGKIVTDKAAEIKSKREIGDAYGMIKASKIGKEWYQQMDALEAWMTGKTVDQVMGMKTKDVDGAKHADEADLVSSVTVSVNDFLAAFDKAVKNAK